MHEALYYKPHQHGVSCELCPKGCVVQEGQTGFCRVRQNIGGKLYTQNYAVCSAYAVDPIEKKPLYHFYPGSNIVSLGTWGCNFSCTFCQNWQIAQGSPETVELMPEKAVAAALAQGKQNVGIAYTYSEPSVWYEYILDTAKLVRQAGLKNVLVTNGFINPKPLDELLPYLDALNIDVKAFNDTFYQKVCSGRLNDVKRTVELAAAACHVEVTTLLIPGQNDDREELAALAKWLAALSPSIPLHFSRYFPNYKMAEPPTPPATMEMAWQTAREFLEYVYLGNMGAAGNNTYCPHCGYLVIDRTTRRSWLAENKKCPHCGSIIRIIGEVCY
jgi:pyruvate formate lyase activating enzyme